MIFGRNVLVVGSFATLFAAVLVLSEECSRGQQPAATGAAATAAPPYGGKYEVLPVMQLMLSDSQEGKKVLRNGEQKMASILRGSEPLQPNLRAVQIYYGQYFFARLTHPEYLGVWPEARQKFITQQLGVRTIPPDVHSYLVDLARQMMTTIIRGNYHPVAQANAMLLLGSLNSDEAVLVGDTKRQAVPLTAALGVMFQELGNPQQSDGVRAAAMAGILRHVHVDNQTLPVSARQLSGPSPSQKNRETLIATTMLKWVNAKDPPEGRSRGGHDWLRRRAIEVLGLLGAPGQGNNVVTALENVLVDNDEALSVRCAAGEALGRLTLPQDGSIDAKQLATKLATVAVWACRKEISRVEEQLAKDEEAKASASGAAGYGGGYGGYEESDYGGYDEAGYGGYEEETGGAAPVAGAPMGGAASMGGFGPMGGYGEEMGDYGGMMGGYGTPAARFNPLGYRIVMTRRRIKSQLLLVKEGLVGPGGPLGANKGVLARASEGEQKDYVNKAIKGIDDIIAIIDANEETEMQPMIEKLSGGVQLLENNCEVVVTLPGEEGEMLDEGLLNPLGLPDGMSGPDAPADAASPAAPTAPGPGPAATPPAAAGPGPAAAPAAGEPAAAEPGLGEVPTGQPPAGGVPPAAPPAGGANP